MFRRRLLTALVAVGVALLFVTGPAMAAPGDGVSTDGADLINDGDQGANDDSLRGDVLEDPLHFHGADLINDGDMSRISNNDDD